VGFSVKNELPTIAAKKRVNRGYQSQDVNGGGRSLD